MKIKNLTEISDLFKLSIK